MTEGNVVPRDSSEGQHPAQTIAGAEMPSGHASPTHPGTENDTASADRVPESPAHGDSVVFTPQVHSTLLEMIGFADAGKCMACGWPLKASVDQGCVQGNCSFRPGEHSHEYQRWWQRTQILTLARKYLSGELGKLSNADDVRNAATGER